MSLGLGSVIASAFEVAPWLMAIGRYNTAAFLTVGALLAVNDWLAVVRPRRMQCAHGEVCHVDSKAMRLAFAASGRAELRHVEIKTLGMD